MSKTEELLEIRENLCQNLKILRELSKKYRDNLWITNIKISMIPLESNEPVKPIIKKIQKEVIRKLERKLKINN